MNQLHADLVDDLKRLISEGRGVRATAYQLGVSVTTVRRYVQLLGLSVKESAGGHPCQGCPLPLPILSVAFLEQLKTPDQPWSDEVCDLLGVWPLDRKDDSWLAAMDGEQIDFLRYRQLEAIIRKQSRDPVPLPVHDTRTVSERYFEFRENLMLPSLSSLMGADSY